MSGKKPDIYKEFCITLCRSVEQARKKPDQRAKLQAKVDMKFEEVEAALKAERKAAQGVSSLGAPKPGRKCHDCKKPTTQYRCPACQIKHRAKHGIPADISGLEAAYD